MAISELLLISGAPVSRADDALLGEMVRSSEATKIVSGGTTARIVARELGQTIIVNMTRNISSLPPTSHIEGIDRVTEGALTLASVRNCLIDYPAGDSVAHEIASMLLAHSKITIIEGMAVNAAHLELGKDFEPRSGVIEQIVNILREKYHKEVTVKKM